MNKSDQPQATPKIAKLNLFGLDNPSSEHETPKLHINLNECQSNRSSTTPLNASTGYHSSPLIEFKKSLDAEKNLSQFILHFDHLLSQPRGNKATEEALGLLEKSYKLQIESLLESVNQLKLEKAMVEKKLEIANKGLTGTENFGKLRFTKCQSDSCKVIMNSKDSTIQELEFQIKQLRHENELLKAANDYQRNEIEKMSHDISENRSLRAQIQELQDEISLLKQKIRLEESKAHKAHQEAQQIKSENISLKLRSHNNSFFELPRHGSGDQSMLSLSELKGGNKTTADWMARRTLRATEATDSGTKDSASLSPLLSPVKNRNLSLMNGSKRDIQELMSGNVSLSKIVINQGTSLKMLNEYERLIQKEIDSNPSSAAKLNPRLTEIKKIKGYYLEQENQKLMALINKQQSERNAERKNLGEKILDDTDLEMSILKKDIEVNLKQIMY